MVVKPSVTLPSVPSKYSFTEEKKGKMGEYE